MVRAQRKLVEHLGVRRIAMVAGGSIGGQQALEWAVSYLELVEKVIVVAAVTALSAQAVAFSEVQRQAIMADPHWQKGHYQPGEGMFPVIVVSAMLGVTDQLLRIARFACTGDHESWQKELEALKRKHVE